MRGKRRDYRAGDQQGRNIPAYAGKTHGWCSRSSAHAEHPRVCGENVFACFFPQCFIGTSPRMRGKRVEHRITHHANRNIPAYAGKTTATSSPHGL